MMSSFCREYDILIVYEIEYIFLYYYNYCILCLVMILGMEAVKIWIQFQYNVPVSLSLFESLGLPEYVVYQPILLTQRCQTESFQWVSMTGFFKSALPGFYAALIGCLRLGLNPSLSQPPGDSPPPTANAGTVIEIDDLEKFIHRWARSLYVNVKSGSRAELPHNSAYSTDVRKTMEVKKFKNMDSVSTCLKQHTRQMIEDGTHIS